MKRPFVAGNWKMNLHRAESIHLASDIVMGIKSVTMCEVAVCPAHVYLDAVSSVTGQTNVRLGAQNVYHQEKGAYTGEVSPNMLVDIGVTCVILGHSERRGLLGETDRDVNLKLKAALRANLMPIVCVGEHLAEREAGQTLAVIRRQFDDSFLELSADEMKKCVIAYEPVWAIGTGRVASPQQAEEVHAELRRILRDRYGGHVAETVRIQYGGSVNADNAAQLLAQPNIDGALVGGASLAAASFLQIVEAAESIWQRRVNIV